MTSQSRTTLKGYFTTNSRPTQTQFENVTDSFTRESAKGNALVGHEVDTTSGSPGVVVMAQLSSSAVNPAVPADTAAIYVKSISGTAEVFTIDEAGNATQQTPHSFTLFDPDPDYEFPYVYRCENPYLGLAVEVDEWGIARAVEELTGKKFIHLAQTEKVPWTSSKPMPKWMKERMGQREKKNKSPFPFPTETLKLDVGYLNSTVREHFTREENVLRSLYPPMPDMSRWYTKYIPQKYISLYRDVVFLLRLARRSAGS